MESGNIKKYSMTFRDRLREELEAQHISKKELASRLGISYSTLLSYIDARGIMPSADMAVRIAQELGVSVEYLVEGYKNLPPEYQELIDNLQEFPAESRHLIISSLLSVIQTFKITSAKA